MYTCFYLYTNPFASIGRTGTSNAKVKVMVICDLIYQFFHSNMKKSSKSSLKKRSLDLSLQHKNQASYKFSKKNFCTWPKTGLALKGLITNIRYYTSSIVYYGKESHGINITNMFDYKISMI